MLTNVVGLCLLSLEIAPTILKICSMPESTYYSLNYAGIFGSGLLKRHSLKVQGWTKDIMSSVEVATCLCNIYTWLIYSHTCWEHSMTLRTYYIHWKFLYISISSQLWLDDRNVPLWRPTCQTRTSLGLCGLTGDFKCLPHSSLFSHWKNIYVHKGWFRDALYLWYGWKPNNTLRHAAVELNSMSITPWSSTWVAFQTFVIMRL